MRLFRLLAPLLTLSAVAFVVSPPALAYPSGVTGTATIDRTQYAPNDRVVVTVAHTTPGRLRLQLPGPTTIGIGTVAADGTGSVSGSLSGHDPGPLVVTARGAGGEVYRFNITVTAGDPGFTSSVTSGCLPGRLTTRGTITVTLTNEDPNGIYRFRITADPGSRQRNLTLDAGSTASTTFTQPFADGTYTIHIIGALSPTTGVELTATVHCDS